MKDHYVDYNSDKPVITMITWDLVKADTCHGVLGELRSRSSPRSGTEFERKKFPLISLLDTMKLRAYGVFLDRHVRVGGQDKPDGRSNIIRQKPGILFRRTCKIRIPI